MSQNVTVNKKGSKRIADGHLWIYKSDITQAEAVGGNVVSVRDERGKFIGKAFYNDQSEISLRFITTKDEAVDREFWRRRILQAASRRDVFQHKFQEKFGSSNRNSDVETLPAAHSSKFNLTNACRLIYSEGDLISSLIVDVYDDVFVLQTLSQGTDALKEVFADILQEEFAPRAIVERNDVNIRRREGLPLTAGVLRGELPDEIVIEQDGIKFFVAPLGGQKTGSFLDQRENHFLAGEMARGNALDCFTFNGGFALNLAKNCEKVRAVDISAEASALAERNAKLNNINNIEFETANVFDRLREMETGAKFDTIILDPPAFTKNRASIEAAARGYKEINLRALKLLNPNGLLVTCSCSFHLSEERFRQTVEAAAADAKRRVQLITKRTQSSDHPILLGMPETYYLKAFYLRVLD